MEFDQYYFVEIKSNPEYKEKSTEEEQERQKNHLEYLSQLSEQELLLAAGPFEGGGGIFFFDAIKLSNEEIQEIIRKDPHYIDNAAIYITKKWFVPKDRIKFNLKSKIPDGSE